MGTDPEWWKGRLMRIAVSIGGLLLALVLLSGCMAPLAFDEQAWRDKVASTSVESLYAAHLDDNGKFFNPWSPKKPGGFIRLGPGRGPCPPRPLA